MFVSLFVCSVLQLKGIEPSNEKTYQVQQDFSFFVKKRSQVISFNSYVLRLICVCIGAMLQEHRLRSWRYGARKIKFWRRSRQKRAAKPRKRKSLSPFSLRLRRQSAYNTASYAGYRNNMQAGAHEADIGSFLCYSGDSFQEPCTQCDNETKANFFLASWILYNMLLRQNSVGQNCCSTSFPGPLPWLRGGALTSIYKQGGYSLNLLGVKKRFWYLLRCSSSKGPHRKLLWCLCRCFL